MAKEKVYIYTLNDPITNDIRYVGKTNNITIRLQGHIDEAKRRKSITHKSNWVISLHNNGLKPILEILDEVPDNEWIFWERYWISQIKVWGFNLTNGTDGGENPPSWKGKKHSEETIKKFSKRMKHNNPSKNMTDAWRSNISKNHKLTGFRPSESLIDSFKKPILQYSLDGVFIKEWDSITEAAKGVNLKNGYGIGACCRGERNKSGNFTWKYKIIELS